MISPELLVSMAKVGFMSPDGRCKTFDAAADGYVRGEAAAWWPSSAPIMPSAMVTRSGPSFAARP